VILGAIMSVLDTTVVNVALDTLGHGAHRAVPLPLSYGHHEMTGGAR
jgi:hypothetical protein